MSNTPRALTDRQREILTFLVEHLLEHHTHAPIREIGRRFDIGSTNGVVCLLRCLEDRGYIVLREKGGGWGRTWRILLTPDGLPFKLGNVASA